MEEGIEVLLVGTTKSKLPCNLDFSMGRQTLDHLLKPLHCSGEEAIKHTLLQAWTCSTTHFRTTNTSKTQVSNYSQMSIS